MHPDPHQRPTATQLILTTKDYQPTSQYLNPVNLGGNITLPQAFKEPGKASNRPYAHIFDIDNKTTQGKPVNSKTFSNQLQFPSDNKENLSSGRVEVDVSTRNTNSPIKYKNNASNIFKNCHNKLENSLEVTELKAELQRLRDENHRLREQCSTTIVE